MKYNFFIKRPILSAVISIIIVLAGFMCLKILPIEQYPRLQPPAVSIRAMYPGASAQTVAQTVAVPIEQQLNGVENVVYMNSVSSAQGMVSITLTFELGTDIDKAETEVNSRVQRILSTLPQTVQQSGVTVNKSSGSILGIVAIENPSETYDPIYLGNYALLNVVDDLKRLPGVGDAQILGNVDYSMRIWLRPDKLAQYKLTPSDVISRVKEQNRLYPVGRFGEEPDSETGAYTYSATAEGRLSSPEEFGNIVLKSDSNGAALLLKDVARIELGTEQYLVSTKLNSKPMVPILINLQSGANALSTMEAVKTHMEEIKNHFPPGIQYSIPFNTTKFIKVSVDEVIHTFIEAIILVILVVFLFLQNWRATLIPVIAVPISIIGTFAGMYLLGFSINMLTLFGLVLAIGIVVDDAIVVLENVERLMKEKDLSPYAAAVESMAEVTGPVIAIVLVLCAVFIPVSFMEGMAGIMYQQFAITIAISVVISGIVALTLTPALCAIILKKEEKEIPRFFQTYNRLFDRLTGKYVHVVEFFIKNVKIGLGVFLFICLLTYYMFDKIPNSLVPNEDQGIIMAFASLPPAASLARTKKTMAEAEGIFLKNPAVKDVTAITGYDMMTGSLKTSAGAFFITLKDWKLREGKKEQDSRNLGPILMGQTSNIQDGFVMAVNPPSIPGLSLTGGFELYLQNRGSQGNEFLYEATEKFIKEAGKRPEIAQISTTFNPNIPQYNIIVDRRKALAMNIPINTIYEAMSTTFGSVYINDFTLYGRNYKVKLQSEEQFRRTPNDLKHVFVRSQNNEMVPLDALVTVERIVGPDQLERFNSFYATRIMGNPAAGYTTGDAIKALQEVAEKELSKDYQIAWSGTSYQELQTSGTGPIAVFFGIIMVFLILAAQYERWTLPLAVITAVPFAAFGALLFALMRGMSNDIYFQIGLVTLVGLASKNAILIVEFAVLEREKGKSAIEAAISAARLRFRPIMMTSMAFILGVLPLAISSGAGSASRHSIGTGIIGGMLAATCLAILIVPMFYTIISKKYKKTEKE